MDALLAVLTVVSFLLAVWSMYRTRREKELAATAATVVSHRIDSATVSLQGAAAAVNAVVQVPKSRRVSVEELQELARVARTQVLVTASMLKETDDVLVQWRAGELLQALARGVLDSQSDRPLKPEADPQPS